MRDGVKIGSSRAMSGLPFPVAGKTGTAQWSSRPPTMPGGPDSRLRMARRSW